MVAPHSEKSDIASISFLRRLAAIFYDSFIVFSFLLVLTAFALLANQGNSLSSYQSLFLGYLIFSTGLFVSWFWHKRGQTLGMLAWKIKVVDQDNQNLSWPHAFYRYMVAFGTIALGGLGLLWC